MSINWTVTDKPATTRRINAKTQLAVDFINALAMDKAAKIPKEDVSTARNAGRFFSEQNPGIVVKTSKCDDGGVLLWKEQKPEAKPDGEAQAG